MGHVVDGQWTTDLAQSGSGGAFVRPPTRFHERVSSGAQATHAPEANRYHLYVSLACPWAHRTLIARQLAGLDGAVSVSVVHWLMSDSGWIFADGPGCTPDHINSAQFLYQVYVAARADYTGRVTVPVLWDKKLGTIVNNESREIIEMFDHGFGEVSERRAGLYPADLRQDIDAMIDANYEPINNGVYRAGFAGNQTAYDAAIAAMFDRLDALDELLSTRRYLCGDTLSAADVCLFTTLFRFDAVYNIHFKCSVKRISDYPSLWPYARDIYQQPGVAGTCNMHHIRNHYFGSHESVNPRRLVAAMPSHLDFARPHDRARLNGA